MNRSYDQDIYWLILGDLYHCNVVINQTDYCGNMIYENETLSRILFDGGYITMSGATPTYHYYIQDHQGNNRVVFN